MVNSRIATWKLVSVLIALFFGELLTAQSLQQQSAPSSPGKAIQDAAKMANQDRAVLEVLTDTHGVDFGPYLRLVLSEVQRNWYAHIPDAAKGKQGQLAIQCVISRNGHLGVQLTTSALDSGLDYAAWAGVTSSAPFPPLPSAFDREFLVLRFHFYYNPDQADLAGDSNSVDRASSVTTGSVSPSATMTVQRDADSIKHAVLIQYFAEIYTPDYPKKAREARAHGIVWLEAEIKANGRVADVKVIEGDSTLAGASIRAIRQWRFQPAKKDNERIEDRVEIEVEFRLDSERVGTYVVWPEQPRGVNLPQ